MEIRTAPRHQLPEVSKLASVYDAMWEHLESGSMDALLVDFDSADDARRAQVAMRIAASRDHPVSGLCQSFTIAKRGVTLWLIPKE